MSDLIDKAEALLPCPFCGEVPAIKERGENIALFVCASPPCKGSDMFMGFVRKDREKAIAAWNRRAIPARGVGVKPLVWKREADNAWVAAHYAIHQYWPHNNGPFAVSGYLGGLGAISLGKHPTLDAAKAAAQADYKARILAALAPTDAAQAREAALKKAAQLAYEVWDDPEALAKAILALIGEERT